MLTIEENGLLTGVGPGTPMGSLMREYWIPAMLVSELPHPDCDPVRVMLLGEKLVAFRDSHGRVGLMQSQCPHRQASLFFGRNEEGGLRCIYHGWKFDVAGNCMDMPNEPPESNFKTKVRANAYPCFEAGGLVWTYMGPRAEPPPMPGFETLSGDGQLTYAFQMECNWLQTLEGDIDTSHFGFLHAGHASASDVSDGTFMRYMLDDRTPRYKVVDGDYGVTYGAYRPAGDEAHTYWRIAHFLFPFFTMIPTGMLGRNIGFVARVPMDDHHTMVLSSRKLWDRDENVKVGITADSFAGMHIMPNTSDWFGRFRSATSIKNDFGIDREQQRSGGSFTGLDGVPLEDRAATESMGQICDRTQEHLGSADVMIIRVRRRLIAAARALAENGVTPPAVDEPEVYLQRSGGVVLPNDADWLDATIDLRAPHTEHIGLDAAIAAGA